MRSRMGGGRRRGRSRGVLCQEDKGRGPRIIKGGEAEGEMVPSHPPRALGFRV